MSDFLRVQAEQALTYARDSGLSGAHRIEVARRRRPGNLDLFLFSSARQRGRLSAASANAGHCPANSCGTVTQSFIALPWPEGSKSSAPLSLSAASCSGVSRTSRKTIAPFFCRQAKAFPLGSFNAGEPNIFEIFTP